ncbi:MAG TPA: sugar-binding transcriptional regulator [Thermotogota bacterium]|nr:sugar-binding transcriptional regulator [Thermotogota bacterium]HPJ90062.1 sugar-binding transcriptional regulator [Thermotogota bacterium]HPR97335.1 sugar-binding transcriptional regulator [Thermotogota bacterium]
MGKNNKNNFNEIIADRELMVRVSWCYYKEGMTQSQIAEKFKTNRAKIMKILEKALKENIVEIRIKDQNVNLLEIEKTLTNKFNLKDSIVVPVHSSKKDEISRQLGMAASQHINYFLTDGDVLGIGWGETVSHTIKNLSLDHIKDFYIVSLSGGLLPLLSGAEFFSRYSEKFRIIPTPLLMSNTNVVNEMRMEPEVREILNMWDLTNHLLVGIGSMNLNATIIKKGYMKETDFAALKRKGAVGDILGRYFDENGELVDFESNERIISFDIAKLRDQQNVIAVAGGNEKIKPIKAAIKGGLVKTLITDERTALELLNDE